ncbi:hypothetical protein [Ferrovibrio sp.]|uniref:hypothetical protein n=1 Tax=Ferrovibrio sp. TaxID=1917215 RepID=UPI0035148626
MRFTPATLPLLAVLLAAGSLAGCVSPLEEAARRAPAELPGLSDSQLRHCAGEPVAKNREGADELWSYFRETSRSATATSDVGYTPTARGSSSYEYFRHCEAVFRLRGGRVVAVELNGRIATGRPAPEPCGAIVETCLRLKGR